MLTNALTRLPKQYSRSVPAENGRTTAEIQAERLTVTDIMPVPNKRVFLVQNTSNIGYTIPTLRGTSGVVGVIASKQVSYVPVNCLGHVMIRLRWGYISPAVRMADLLKRDLFTTLKAAPSSLDPLTFVTRNCQSKPHSASTRCRKRHTFGSNGSPRHVHAAIHVNVIRTTCPEDVPPTDDGSHGPMRDQDLNQKDYLSRERLPLGSRRGPRTVI